MQNAQILSVSEVNSYIKNLLSGDFLLRSLWIKGELSNFKRHSSGHLYFSLKDDTGMIKCVMFKSNAAGLNFRPEHGMMVLAAGYISVYERDGAYQFYVSEMLTAGAGALNIAYEKLKNRLEAEGLFAQERKRTLPFLPKRIGIVTSPTGAAVHDLVSIIKRRNPKVDILIVPAQVQGVEGISSLVNALDKIYKMSVDVIIAGRGGGSLEELWCFNEEKVVRKIAQSPVPIISAVGHETDFTLADFAADVRAATPSMAAELAVPVLAQLEELVDRQKQRLLREMERLIAVKRQQLMFLAKHSALGQIEQFLAGYRQYVDQLSQKLSYEMQMNVEQRQKQLAILAGKLDALSPLKVLKRGYAVCENNAGQILYDINKVNRGEYLKITLLNGALGCIVQDKEVENNGEEKIDI